MKETIILIGGGGHCKSCIDVIEQEGRLQIAGIVDVPEKKQNNVQGSGLSRDRLRCLFIGLDKDFPRYTDHALGHIKSRARRMKFFNDLMQLGSL